MFSYPFKRLELTCKQHEMCFTIGLQLPDKIIWILVSFGFLKAVQLEAEKHKAAS